VESLAASTGSTSLLQNAFSKLADPQTNAIPLQSLQVLAKPPKVNHGFLIIL
jgi:hypothetical protein